jgi:Tfp pilus assembly protein PilF
MKPVWMVQLLAGGLLLVGGAGCQTLLPGGFGQQQTAPRPVQAEARQSQDLPAVQTAEIELVMAEGMARKGDPAAAAIEYEKARERNPRVADTVARRLAVLYDRLGETARAQVEFDKAVKAYPKDADLINDYGYFLYNRGNWADAEKQLRRALDLDGHHRRAWMNLGMALAQQQRYQESLEAFANVVSPAECHANLAFLLTTQGKREEAKEEYRVALRLEPTLRLAEAALAKMEQAVEIPAPSPFTAAETGNP